MKKKGILRNALVFLFSIMFTMSAYAADGYAADYTATQTIEQYTMAPTSEMLNGTAWYIATPENIMMLVFQDNIISIGGKDKYGNTSTIIGEYQLDGNKMNVTYLGAAENGKVRAVTAPVYKTHYIGLTDNDSCVFSMDGTDYTTFIKQN